MRMKIVAAASGLLLTAGATFGGVTASAAEQTRCEEAGVSNGPLTEPVHELHEVSPEPVSGVLHDNVEPLTCDPPQFP